jgi:hypothetical protein
LYGMKHLQEILQMMLTTFWLNSLFMTCSRK